MLENPAANCKCTRCRHKFHESEKVPGPQQRNGSRYLLCPKCGCKTHSLLPAKAALQDRNAPGISTGF